MLVMQMIQVWISKHNKCYYAVFNNFYDDSFLTQYFMINFMFVFPKVFSERGYKITLTRQDVNLYHLKSGRIYFVIVCEISYEVSIFDN